MERKKIRRVLASLPKGMKWEDFEELWRLYQKQGRAGSGNTNLLVLPIKQFKDANRINNSKEITAHKTKPPKKREEATAVWKQEKESKQYTTTGLLGLFYLRYKKWCLSDYRNGLVKSNWQQLDVLVKREGTQRVYRAINELFKGKHLAWVKHKNLDFLCNIEFWSRFVAPALVEYTKYRGEQAESKHERSSTFTVTRRK